MSQTGLERSYLGYFGRTAGQDLQGMLVLLLVDLAYGRRRCAAICREACSSDEEEPGLTQPDVPSHENGAEDQQSLKSLDGGVTAAGAPSSFYGYADLGMAALAILRVVICFLCSLPVAMPSGSAYLWLCPSDNQVQLRSGRRSLLLPRPVFKRESKPGCEPRS